MRYALIANGQVQTYPYTYAQFRAANPETSFPRDPSEARLAEFGIYPVAETARPVPPLEKNVIEGTPTLVNGKWTQQWVLVDASAEEVAERQKEVTAKTQRGTIQADSFVQTFIGMTPAQVTNYVNTNVTDLPSAKNVIQKLALMMLLLARREFGG